MDRARASFLKYTRNARLAQPRFISPYFSYLLEKTVINCFFFGDPVLQEIISTFARNLQKALSVCWAFFVISWRTTMIALRASYE